jgi:glycosyltransferase involved in cell wall biosynthesis
MAERPGVAGAPPKILYVVTEDWFFASHFLPMARAARQAGLDVAVATRVSGKGEAIASEGIRVIPVQVERGRPSGLLSQIRILTRVAAAERPAIVHCIALRSIVAGGIAARRAGVQRLVLAPTGLGNLWTRNGIAAALGRSLVRSTIRRLRDRDTVFLFENHEDPVSLGLAAANGDRIAFVNGAGVDPSAFPPQPMPPPSPLRLAMVARMLWPKGPGVVVEALRLARSAGVEAELDLYGQPDPSNALSVPTTQLEAWSREPGVRWHGHVSDVAGVWRRSHAAVLPTHYREGLPRALIEAMASARPILTTDVPGCRELVRNAVNGFLVPPSDPGALAAAIRRLASDLPLLESMGKAARRLFEERYTASIVIEQAKAVYRGLLPPEGGPGGARSSG